MDVSFGHGDVLFTERAAAIIIHEGKVLLETSRGVDFWTLPGGRVSLMEMSSRAISREIAEELGVCVVRTRLVWVVESFFSCKHKKHHELGFYYLVDVAEESPILRSDSPIIRADKPGDAESLTFAWQDMCSLESLSLLPEFLKTALKSIPASLEHIIQIEGQRTS